MRHVINKQERLVRGCDRVLGISGTLSLSLQLVNGAIALGVASGGKQSRFVAAAYNPTNAKVTLIAKVVYYAGQGPWEVSTRKTESGPYWRNPTLVIRRSAIKSGFPKIIKSEHKHPL